MTEQTSPEIALVKEIFASWGPTSEHFWASFETYFDENTVWENVGMATTVGKDEALAFARSFPLDFAYMSVDLLNIVSHGPIVMNERVDYFHNDAGEIVASIRVAGIFKLEGKTIREWRDYFDTAPLGAAA